MKNRLTRAFFGVFVFTFCLVFFGSKIKPASAAVFAYGFEGSQLDPNVWKSFVRGAGTGVAEQNGRLEISFSQTAYEDPYGFGYFAAGVQSRCQLRGDFDVTVDYELPLWPNSNGIRTAITVDQHGDSPVFSDGTVGRFSFGKDELSHFFAPRELYAATSSTFRFEATSDKVGILRMIRTGGGMKGYYWNESANDWTIIGEPIPIAKTDMHFNLGAWAHDFSYRRESDAKIYYDNFIVNSGQLVCPEPEVTPTPTVVVFKQTDPRWKDKQYAYETGKCSTIEKCGCVLSTVAMTLNHHGANKDPLTGEETTPETVNDYFKLKPIQTKCKNEFGDWYQGTSSLGYYCGFVNWAAPDIYSADAYKKYGTQKILWLTKKTDLEWSANTVKQDTEDSRPVILKVLNDPHWALATGVIDNTFSINDPSFNRTRLDQAPYTNSAFAIRRYIKTSSDFSRLQIATFAPNNILITDPDGNRTGYNTSNSSNIEEIPESSYFFDKAIDDDTNDEPPPPDTFGINWLVISTPKQGRYTVNIISPLGEESNYVIYASDREAGLTFNAIEPLISNEESEYVFDYNPESGAQTLVLQVPIDIKPGSDENPINCKDKNSTIPVAILSTETFNALDVDHTSVTFEGAKEIHVDKKTEKAYRHEEDVNGDGKMDLILHFRQEDTQLACQSINMLLTGKTKSGLNFEGKDNIKALTTGNL